MGLWSWYWYWRWRWRCCKFEIVYVTLVGNFLHIPWPELFLLWPSALCFMFIASLVHCAIFIMAHFCAGCALFRVASFAFVWLRVVAWVAHPVVLNRVKPRRVEFPCSGPCPVPGPGTGSGAGAGPGPCPVHCKFTLSNSSSARQQTRARQWLQLHLSSSCGLMDAVAVVALLALPA